MEPTHHIYSRTIYEEEWQPLLAPGDGPIAAWVKIDNGTVTVSSNWQFRFHDEREYQLRPIPASPP
jgi:hypothetical protein